MLSLGSTLQCEGAPVNGGAGLVSKGLQAVPVKVKTMTVDDKSPIGQGQEATAGADLPAVRIGIPCRLSMTSPACTGSISGHPIESTFATVRLRTAGTQGCVSRQGILSMVYQLGLNAENRWRRLRGFRQFGEVIAGAKFVAGRRTADASVGEMAA